MTVQELIDDALLLGDNVSPTSADYVVRRRAALRYLRQIVNEVWWLRDHKFKKTSAQLTVPVNEDHVELPLDFDSLGVYGRVYRSEDGEPMTEVPESVITDMNADTAFSSADYEKIFSLHGQDASTFLGYLRVPRAASARVFDIHYQIRPPHLLDAGDTASVSSLAVTLARSGYVVTATTASAHGYSTGQWAIVSGASAAAYNGTWQIIVTGDTTFTYTITTTPATPDSGASILDLAKHNRAILAIPEKYHESVLAWGLKERMRESKGDNRWEYALAQYEKGKKSLLTEESRFQGTFRQLPSFFGREYR